MQPMRHRRTSLIVWLGTEFAECFFDLPQITNAGEFRFIVSEVTRILTETKDRELRGLAAARISREKPGQALQATALVPT